MVADLFLSLLPDMGGGVIIAILGLVIGAAVLLFIGIVSIEAFILHLMDWPSARTALLDSFWVNLVTTVLGLVLGFWDVVFLSPGMWVVLWVMSVVIEGVLLQIIKRQAVRKTWEACLVMNIVSYIVLYVIYALTPWS